MSQEEFGARYNIGSQGMMWQLLNGRRPLNLKAAVGFAQGLHVPLEEISAEIADEVKSAARYLADFSFTDGSGNVMLVELKRHAKEPESLPEYVQNAFTAMFSAYEGGASRELFDAVRVIFSLLPSADGASIKPSHKASVQETPALDSASRSVEAQVAWEEQETENALRARGGGSSGTRATGDRKRKGARH